MKPAILLLAITLLALSCNDDTVAITDKETPNQIFDTWLQTEYGYSPGSGYFVEPVAPTPPRIITFGGNRRLSTNIEGLTKYKYYRVLEDVSSQDAIVAFFEDDPGGGPVDIATVNHSYLIELNGSSLTLRYRWCFEGCHLGFRRLTSSTND